MTMKITRKGFLGAAASGTVLLLLQACGGGGGGDDDDDPPGGLGSCSADGGAISGNHGHSLSIPAADLDSATALSYSIRGSANHDHTVTLSAAQLAMLKADQSITVTSSTDSAHDHSVTITCA